MTTAAHPVSARVRVWLGWALAVATVVLCGAGTNFGGVAMRAIAARTLATPTDSGK